MVDETEYFLVIRRNMVIFNKSVLTFGCSGQIRQENSLGKKIIKPQIKAVIEQTNTAPAATFFTNRAVS